MLEALPSHVGNRCRLIGHCICNRRGLHVLGPLLQARFITSNLQATLSKDLMKSSFGGFFSSFDFKSEILGNRLAEPEIQGV